MMSEGQQMVCTHWSICAITFWLRHLLPQTIIRADQVGWNRAKEIFR